LYRVYFLIASLILHSLLPDDSIKISNQTIVPFLLRL